MERSLSSKENLYFDPKTGKLCTSRPANDSSRPTGDQAIAVDVNKPGSGRFLAFHLELRNKDQRTIFLALPFSTSCSAPCWTTEQVVDIV